MTTGTNDNIRLGATEDDGFAKLFEIRNVLSGAVAKQGIKIEGAGMGMGPNAG
jgi:hypothetical protein